MNFTCYSCLILHIYFLFFIFFCCIIQLRNVIIVLYILFSFFIYLLFEMDIDILWEKVRVMWYGLWNFQFYKGITKITQNHRWRDVLGTRRPPWPLFVVQGHFRQLNSSHGPLFRFRGTRLPRTPRFCHVLASAGRLKHAAELCLPRHVPKTQHVPPGPLIGWLPVTSLLSYVWLVKCLMTPFHSL